MKEGQKANEQSCIAPPREEVNALRIAKNAAMERWQAVYGTHGAEQAKEEFRFAYDKWLATVELVHQADGS